MYISAKTQAFEHCVDCEAESGLIMTGRDAFSGVQASRCCRDASAGGGNNVENGEFRWLQIGARRFIFIRKKKTCRTGVVVRKSRIAVVRTVRSGSRMEKSHHGA